jgi:hypothetical protein
MIEEATPGNRLMQFSRGARSNNESGFQNVAGERHHGEERERLPLYSP